MTTDPFDDAREGYVTMDDLQDRLLLVYPTGVTGQRESNIPGSQGKMYDWIETDCVVLDGEPSDLIDVPGTQELFQFSGANVVNTLRLQIKRGKPALGRLVKRPPAKRGLSPSWHLAAPEAADKVLALKYLADNPPPAKPEPFDAGSAPY